MMPDFGTLTFDYVSCRRLLEDVPVIGEAAFNDILNLLNDSKAPASMQVDVLRANAHRLSLLCVQLRQLLGVYEDVVPRGDIFVLMYFRVVDIQNEKVFRVGFENAEMYSKLSNSLGHATSFPFIQPEQFSFQYDLSFNDQRVATLIIFKLLAAEAAGNLKEADYKSPSGNKADETSFWRALKDGSLDKLPPNGVFKGKYICAPEQRNYKTRCKLIETYGLWRVGVPEGKVLWWASLFEAPPDVLEFTEWLLPRVKDVASAFYLIDGSVPGGSVSNGEITLKEFEAGLLSMGCKKFAGPNEKQTIASIFRYLDPTGEGAISKGEWSVLESLWQEMALSIQEFVRFLGRTIGGSLQQWWEAIDVNSSDDISFDEWAEICKRVGFFGAVRQIFNFLDKDDEGHVSFSEFEALSVFESKPLPG